MSKFATNIDDIPEFIAPSPYTRSMKILFDQIDDPDRPFSAALFKLQPGQKGPAHKHSTEIEIYIALQGKGTVTFNNETVYTLSPKHVLYIPPKTTHETVNDGSEDLIFFGIFVPPVKLSDICKDWQKYE